MMARVKPALGMTALAMTALAISAAEGCGR